MKITLLVLIAVSYNCATGKHEKSPSKIFEAWNEDTVNTYLFVAYSNKFYYLIKNVDSSNNVSHRSYSGRVIYGIDSIVLQFKGNRPAELEPYLIVEASGGYLIQYLALRKSRYFLRITNRLGRHFW